MNKTFKELREIAAKKRDDAINQARAEYSDSIERIAELETNLIGSLPRKPRKRRNERKPSLTDLIYQGIPDDDTFTIDDACGFILAADPERQFAKSSIRTIVNRMKLDGFIKQVHDGTGKNRAIYAFPHVECEEQKTLVDLAIEILVVNERPMTSMEIMVAMVEAGYELQASAPESHDGYQHALRGCLDPSGQSSNWNGQRHHRQIDSGCR